jgi:hypothetical protein
MLWGGTILDVHGAVRLWRSAIRQAVYVAALATSADCSVKRLIGLGICPCAFYYAFIFGRHTVAWPHAVV